MLTRSTLPKDWCARHGMRRGECGCAGNHQAQNPTELRDMLADLLGEIALHRPELKVESFLIADEIVEVRIEAAPGDVKRIIGGKGAHFKAIRFFCRTWGMTNGFEVSVREFDSPKVAEDRYQRFQANPNWPRQRLTDILARMVRGALGQATEIEYVRIDPENSHLIFRLDALPPIGFAEAMTVLANAIGKRNGHTLNLHLRGKK